MPGADIARIFGTIFSKAEERAKAEEDKANKAKQEDVQMYQKVLFDPNSSPEQRQKAADQITKLRGINKKESPFGKIAGMLNHVRSKVPQSGQGGSQPMDEKNPVTGQPPVPIQSNVGQEQPKPRGQAMQALGRMFSGQGLLPRHPQQLPPLDPSVFPTATDIATAQANAEKITHVNQFKQVQEDFKQAFGRDMTKEEVDTHFKLTPPPKITTKLEQDAGSPTGWSFVSYDQVSGKEYSRQQNAPPQRGLIPSDTDTDTIDPAGQKTHTHSHRQPVLGSGSKPGASTPPRRQLMPISQPKATTGHSGATSKTGNTVYDKFGLDQNGEIPADAKVNPQLREGANQLLDGQDISKLKMPTKDVMAAAELARKYGWSQGKFTPKEQVMLRESTTFLKNAVDDKALKALDGDFTERMKMAQVAKNPDKEGMIGRGLSVVAAQNLTEDQKNFIQMYNQLVGTISGLAQLVRSGRATEATIERLKAELPNPVSTKDSKDARERIQRILKEVDVAMQKGTFTGTGEGKDPKAVEDILRKHKVID